MLVRLKQNIEAWSSFRGFVKHFLVEFDLLSVVTAHWILFLMGMPLDCRICATSAINLIRMR
ncbi:MAG: hypothetical protein BGO00_06090 [Alphaproteobacteria bacterium 62-8]|nr:MAG: hypothetical protein BGO00_06090 [Alphaproteobacteria bacterium 62-8]